MRSRGFFFSVFLSCLFFSSYSQVENSLVSGKWRSVKAKLISDPFEPFYVYTAEDPGNTLKAVIGQYITFDMHVGALKADSLYNWGLSCRSYATVAVVKSNDYYITLRIPGSVHIDEFREVQTSGFIYVTFERDY